jgi:spiro-SPASM protein
LNIFLKENIKDEEELNDIYFVFSEYEYIYFDNKINSEILDESIKYQIEYYYGEGFPEGIVGQIVNGSIIKDIFELANEQDDVHKNFIFDILLRNVSFFDIDLIEGEEDFEVFRYSLTLSKKEDIPLIDYILDNIENKQNISFNEIKTIVKKNPEKLRTIPKAIFIEVSSKCNFQCIHCPYSKGIKREKEFLTADEIEKLYKGNIEFFDDKVIVISGFGEPFLNPEIIEIIDFFSQNHNIIVETNGSYFNSDIMKKLKNPDKVKFIVSIDSATENTFNFLGKSMNFKKLETFLKYFLEKYPQNFYIQFVRMKQNDFEVEQFYEKWKNFEKNIIFRKYNNYSGVLEDNEVADLTPINRFPCFHLRRDFYILSDGKVALCKSDINGDIADSNVFEEGMEIIWQKLEKFYKLHLEKKYIPMCKNCNEFYTFYF